jgi:hypothetical protein
MGCSHLTDFAACCLQVDGARAFGFIEFCDMDVCTAALSLDGVAFQGRQLCVKRPNDYAEFVAATVSARDGMRYVEGFQVKCALTAHGLCHVHCEAVALLGGGECWHVSPSHSKLFAPCTQPSHTPCLFGKTLGQATHLVCVMKHMSSSQRY